MNTTTLIAILVSLTFASSVVASNVANADDHTILPSEETRNAIDALESTTQTERPDHKPELWYFNVNPTLLPAPSRKILTFGRDQSVKLPFVAPNTMILQFESDVSEEQILDYLRGHKFSVVRKFPKIGAVQIETDLSPYFQIKVTDRDVNEALLRGLVQATEDFQRDPRIRSASPDLLLRNQNHHEPNQHKLPKNLLNPVNVHVRNSRNTKETVDWGIIDIEANDLWDLPGASDGVLFGAVDVGFARHEDIVFLELPSDTDIDDHGNHVVGIACAQHNGTGIRGVLPNCFVRAQSSDVFFKSIEGGSELYARVFRFSVLFSQILITLRQFVDSQDDVRTLNVSLGYNWRSNFGINPDQPESSPWRTLVESQGVMVAAFLKVMNAKDKVIFSAAGNDSYGLPTPMNARYASPFNWAALYVRENEISNNGVIVEAHDRTGNRALFSNAGGHISCPGVDIESTLAFDSNGNQSASAYGTMSGTSMASPYCAAGHLLFKLVRPGYSGVDAVRCLENSSAVSDSGVPMLRLKEAVETCPAKT